MMRMMRGRWFWGIAGALTTLYFLQRSRRQPHEAIRGNGFTADDVVRAGQTALDAAVRTGQRIAETTARALARQR